MNSIIVISGLIASIMAIVACISVIKAGINYAQGGSDIFDVLRTMIILILSIGVIMIAIKYIKKPDQVFANSQGMDIVNVEQTTTTVPTEIQCTTREITEATTVEATVPTTIETTISQQELSVKELKKAWNDAEHDEYKFYYVHNDGRKDRIQAKYYDYTKYNVEFDHKSQVVYISDK